MFLFGSKDSDKNENNNNSDSEKEEVIQYKLEIPDHFKLPVSFPGNNLMRCVMK